MIGSILGKALISVKADTSQAKAAIKDLSATEQKAARERIEAQEQVNNAWDSSLKRHAVMMAGITAGIAVGVSSLKKYEQHLKDIGNTGDGQLRRIQQATESVNRAQDTLQLALGKIVVAALPVVEAFAQMAQELGNIAGGIAAIVDLASGLGGGRVGRYVGASMKWGRRLTPGLGQISYGIELYDRYLGTPDQSIADTSHMGSGSGESVSVSYGVESREAIHPRVARALGWIYVSGPGGGYWRPPTDAEQKAKEAKSKEHAKNAMRQADIYAKAWRVISADIDATSGRARGGEIIDDGWDGFLARQAGETFKGADFGQFGEYEDIRAERIAESIRAAKEVDAVGEQRESMLARIFGPVSEFETYAALWRGLEHVVASGLDAWISGSQSAGEAMKQALHGFAKGLAGEAVLQALRHTAYGIGMLAFPDPMAKVSAAQHFKAAAAWGGVAVAAAAVGKATAPSQAGGASAGGGAYAAAGIGVGGRGGGGSSNLTVVMGDQFAGDSPRYVARRTRRNINNARVYADYEEAA